MKLRSLTEAERDRLFRELGFLAYCRLWRAEMRELQRGDEVVPERGDDRADDHQHDAGSQVVTHDVIAARPAGKVKP